MTHEQNETRNSIFYLKKIKREDYDLQTIEHRSPPKTCEDDKLKRNKNL